MQKLPGLTVAVRAYQLLIAEFGTILRLAWAPLLVAALSRYLAIHLLLVREAARRPEDRMPIGGESPFWLVPELISLAAMVIVVVAIHRLILLRDRKPGTYLCFAFGRVESIFLMLAVLVFVTFLLWALFIAFLTDRILGREPASGWGMAALVVISPLTYLWLRLALLWPIAVVRENYGWKESWALTRGNALSLAGALIAAWALPYAAARGLAAVIERGIVAPHGFGSGGIVPVLERTLAFAPVTLAFDAIVQLCLSTLVAAVLSYSYLILHEGHDPGEAAGRGTS